MRIGEFVRQLGQRRVFRAAAIYVAGIWVVLQVADVLAGDGIVPESWVQGLILLAAIGLPLVLIGSWFLEASWKARSRMATAGDLFIIAAFGVGAALFAWQQWVVGTAEFRVSVGNIEATDLQPATEDLADHLEYRLSELLDADEDADLLLTGTLARGGDVLRLTMTLTDSTGERLWSETYEEALVDIAALQLGFIKALAQEAASLRSRSDEAERLLDACAYPENAAAILALVGDDEPELLATHIKENTANGLLYLEQSLRWYAAVADAPPHQKSVLFALAMRSLDEAQAACPEYPRIDAARIAYNQLESPR